MSSLAPLPDFPPITGDPEPDDSERYYLEELSLAFRNRGMPLEALQYPVTPTGLHYLLIHFDIPIADADAWKVEIGGLVERPTTLDLKTIKAMPKVSRPVTMECAGNGRARMSPRPVSQPLAKWRDRYGRMDRNAADQCDRRGQASARGGRRGVYW